MRAPMKKVHVQKSQENSGQIANDNAVKRAIQKNETQ